MDKITDNFNQRVKNIAIKYELERCLCGSKDFKKIYSYDRFGLWSPSVICKKCGLIQNNPRLTDDEYNRFYSSDEYRILFEGKDYLKMCETRYERNEGKHIFEKILPFMKKFNYKSVLEIGCGGGWNLIHFKNVGYETIGFDLSFELVKFGKSKKLNLFQGSEVEVAKEKRKYDVIILNHVIEHFTNFFGAMKIVLKNLKPNGILYAGVPNIDVFNKGQFQIAHIHYFTPRTFNYYMGKCGLKMVDFGQVKGYPMQSSHMHGIYKISENINSDIALEKEYIRMKKHIMLKKIRIMLVDIMNFLHIKEIMKKITT